ANPRGIAPAEPESEMILAWDLIPPRLGMRGRESALAAADRILLLCGWDLVEGIGPRGVDQCLSAYRPHTGSAEEIDAVLGQRRCGQLDAPAVGRRDRAVDGHSGAVQLGRAVGAGVLV